LREEGKREPNFAWGAIDTFKDLLFDELAIGNIVNLKLGPVQL